MRSSHAVLLAVLAVSLPLREAEAGKLAKLARVGASLGSLKNKTKRNLRKVGLALLGRGLDDNHLHNQGFETAGQLLDSIRIGRKDLLTQTVPPGRAIRRTGKFGLVIDEHRVDRGAEHTSIARLEMQSPHGVTDREYVRSTAVGGPGGKVVRATTVQSIALGDATRHHVSDERAINRLLRIEQKATLTTQNGWTQSAVSKAYLKVGSKIKIRLPMRHMDLKTMEDHVRRASLPIHWDTGSATPEKRGASSPPVNIALGLRSTGNRGSIDEFGEHVGGISYHGWHNHGLLSELADSRGKWNENLSKALNAAVDHGGRIKFDVTGVERHNKMTSNELRLIHATPKFLARTDFYVHTGEGGYRQLDQAELAAMWKRID